MFVKYKKNKFVIIIFVSMIVFFVAFVCYFSVKNDVKSERVSSKSKEVKTVSPNTMIPSIMLDGCLYYNTGDKFDVDGVDLSAVSYIKSVISGSEYPKENGEINFPCKNAKYLEIEQGVAIEINGDWVIFSK